MNTIQVLDKSFRIYLTEKEIQERVKAVAAQINEDLVGKQPIFISVLNGSFLFAADLYRQITLPSQISFVKLASYEGTDTTGKVRQLLGLNEELKGRTVVVIEDIIDSGLTMQALLHMLEAHEPAEIRIAALLVKPGKLKVDLQIPYRCFDIPNDFIVGYGLDYDQYGRNLRDIYVIND